MSHWFCSTCLTCWFSADYWNPIRVEYHSSGGFISPGQVVEVFAVLVLLSFNHLLILLKADHQTFMRNGLDVILINVRGLVQCPLKRESRAIYQTVFNQTKMIKPFPWLVFLPPWSLSSGWKHAEQQEDFGRTFDPSSAKQNLISYKPR